jgi:hypothetical protein
MSEPIFVLGCHRSGTSVIAGLLYRACGVSMGELMPPTLDNPMGYFEALGVVDAHRDLLAQMERDWTCPPSTFQPGLLDLTALEEQVKIHHQLPGVWAMKDPRSMFLLPAWSHLGVDRVRLIAVVRPPADTVRSIEKRDHVRQDRAEAIVDAYLRRLVEIADKVPLAVVHFPGDGDSLIGQIRDLAASLDLPWDESAARSLFDETLIRNRSPLRDSSPTYDALVKTARYPKKVPAINLGWLDLSSEPEWPLESHLGVRYTQQRNQLWEMAHFSTDPEPHIVEVLLEGARTGGRSRPGVRLDQVEVKSPLAVGATLMRDIGRTHGVIAHGLLTDRSLSEIEYFFRSIYINTDPLAELLVDVPDPQGKGLLNATPPPPDHPLPIRVQEIAMRCGWEHVVSERLSPGRSGMFFRKRVLTDSELIPVVTDLIASLHRIHTIEDRLASTQGRLQREGIHVSRGTGPLRDPDPGTIEAERKRADTAERDLERLRNRRSVKLALALARPTRGVFRAVRSWKKSR